MPNRDLKYWIALKWVEGVGNVGFKTLLNAFGSPQQVFAAPFSMLMAVPGIGAKAARQIKDFSDWEKVEKESKTYPDDPVLSKLRADLGVKASEFVTAIENGRQHEEKQQIGSALGWYLKAKRMHPPSDFARDGVKRLVDHIQTGGEPPAANEPPSALNN
jgi:NAD-dependent DNA ligase